MAAAAVAISPELRGRLCEIAAPVRMQAVQSRLWSARVALSIWKDHPVFGGGAGSFAREGIERMGELLPTRKEHECLRSIAWARETHCDPLQFAAEFGVVGLALAILFAVFILRGLPRNETGRSVAAAAVFLTAASLFSFSWQTTLAAPVVGLLAGMALGEKPSGAAPGPAAMFGLGKAWRLGSVTVSAACWFVVAVTAAADFSVEMHLCRRSGDELRPQGYPWRAPAFVHGRYLEKLAADALACGDARFAAEAGRKAVDEWSSPSTLAVRASALEASGRRKEALDAWRRLRRSGFLHDVALKSESASAEALGRIAEAAESEAERFRLWPRSFSDGELFRLCALSLLSGNAARAETLSRTFLRRCERLGETDRRWTPAWENLRGGALLALGRREKARACFESALRRDPALQSARRNLDAMLCQDEDHRPNGN